MKWSRAKVILTHVIHFNPNAQYLRKTTRNCMRRKPITLVRYPRTGGARRCI